MITERALFNLLTIELAFRLLKKPNRINTMLFIVRHFGALRYVAKWKFFGENHLKARLGESKENCALGQEMIAHMQK